VKEKRFTEIQRNFAAWMALYPAVVRLTGTLIGRLMDAPFSGRWIYFYYAVEVLTCSKPFNINSRVAPWDIKAVPA